jgi:hypothetical protein
LYKGDHSQGQTTPPISREHTNGNPLWTDIILTKRCEVQEAELTYLARPLLDDNEGILADCSGLLRVSRGGSGIGLGLELMFSVRHDDQ